MPFFFWTLFFFPSSFLNTSLKMLPHLPFPLYSLSQSLLHLSDLSQACQPTIRSGNGLPSSLKGIDTTNLFLKNDWIALGARLSWVRKEESTGLALSVAIVWKWVKGQERGIHYFVFLQTTNTFLGAEFSVAVVEMQLKCWASLPEGCELCHSQGPRPFYMCRTRATRYAEPCWLNAALPTQFPCLLL